MAQAVPVTIAAPSGQRAYGGMNAPAVLSGAALFEPMVASGTLAGATAPVASITVVETGSTYSTLAAAIAAAASGQTITVPAGSTLIERQLAIGSKTLTIQSSLPGVPFTIDASTISTPGGSAIMSVSGGALKLVDARLTGNKFEYSSFNPGITTYANSGLVWLRRVEIDQCSNGILHADSDTGTTWLLEYCHIHDNGDYSGLMHNLYFGKSPEVRLLGSWVHNTKMRQDYDANWKEPWGHLVKSRSKKLTIVGCRLTMEVYSTTGGANRCIDHPCGGELTVIGNLIEYRTNQNGGQGQAIGWGLEGAARIAGSGFESDRLFKVNIQQNTIVARSASGSSVSNRDAIWIGVGCVNQEGWANTAATPAPTEYIVKDNIFAGWRNTPPRVNEGPSATASTTYAISTTDNTCGGLELLTDAAAYNYQPVTPVAGSQAWAGYQYQHPANAVVRSDSYRGAVYGGWGTGTDAGSISGDLATPGRDGSGRINAAFWATLTPMRMYLLAGTRLDQLDAAIKAQVSPWSIRGNEGWNSVTMDWCGVALDDTAGQEVAYMGPGGGHDGGSFNGIVALDVRKAQWRVEMLPTTTQYWPGTYSAGFTSYPSAYDYYWVVNPNNPQGVFSDEIFDAAYPTDPVRSSRAWTSRHTYCSGAIGNGKYMTGCRRYWEYDLATKSLALPKFPFGNQNPYTNDQGFGGENVDGWFSPTENRYYFKASQNGYANSRTWSVLVGGTGWRDEGQFPVGGYTGYFSRITRMGTKLWTLIYDNDGGRPGKPINLFEADQVNRSNYTNHPITLSGTLATRTFKTVFYNQSAPVYLPGLGKWLCIVGTNEGGEEWVFIDATTYVATLANLTEPAYASYPYNNERRVENKVWVTGGVLFWIHRADENIRAMVLG